MEHNCERHPFEVAEGVCRSCLGSFCGDCLLYPFGPDADPYCKPCAITAGGVRSTARNRRRVNTGHPPSGKKAKGRSGARSGGLFGRLRRNQIPGEDEPVEVEDEQLDDDPSGDESVEDDLRVEAQRLPTEPEEEAGTEPPPAPNIAPPASRDEEPELNHRPTPDEVAGGLDLSGAEVPDAEPTPTDRTHDWDQPEPPTDMDAPTGARVEPVPVPSADTFTADGTPLFASTSSEPATPEDPPLEPPAPAPGPAIDEPQVSNPEPAAMTPEPAAINLDPTAADPPEAVTPDPAAINPESAAMIPEPTEPTIPEPAAMTPEPTEAITPEPAAITPEPAAMTPEPTEAITLDPAEAITPDPDPADPPGVPTVTGERPSRPEPVNPDHTLDDVSVDPATITGTPDDQALGVEDSAAEATSSVGSTLRPTADVGPDDPDDRLDPITTDDSTRELLRRIAELTGR